MCIIIIKKAGINLPSRDILESAWNNNPDGGGYMLPDRKGKQVIIRKGFMSFKAFMKSLNTVKNIKDEQLIIHFRITTHGGTLASNTHPFPLSSNKNHLKALRTSSDVGIAHNGVINIDNEKDISDTMQFIKDELSLFNVINKRWYKDIKALEYIGNRIQSKLAIMDKTGYIATIGDFYEDEGILYSNYSYAKYNNYIPFGGNYDTYYNYYDTYYNIDDPVGIDLSNPIVEDLQIIGLNDYEIKVILDELTDTQLREIIEEPDALDILLDYIYIHQ